MITIHHHHIQLAKNTILYVKLAKIQYTIDTSIGHDSIRHEHNFMDGLLK